MSRSPPGTPTTWTSCESSSTAPQATTPATAEAGPLLGGQPLEGVELLALDPDQATGQLAQREVQPPVDLGPRHRHGGPVVGGHPVQPTLLELLSVEAVEVGLSRAVSSPGFPWKSAPCGFTSQRARMPVRSRSSSERLSPISAARSRNDAGTCLLATMTLMLIACWCIALSSWT